jgi:hypothetical protein
MGLYRANDQLYHSLYGIIHFLETMSPISTTLLDSAPRLILNLISQINAGTELEGLLTIVKNSLK